ncbi:MAG: SWIM zinc finger family protein [Haloarculaceae archaeon]
MPERSVRAWVEAMAVAPLGGGRYRVDSQSGERYVVDLPAGDCTCPDHEVRGARCKHIRRVAIEINEGEIPPPGRRRGTCAACGREAFVPEREEPALCSACRLAPGDFVTDRETGDTLVVVRVRPERADEVEIEGTDATVAAYPTNEGYPAADPVVEAVYPFSGRPTDDVADLPRYSFPLSRLARRDEQLVT